MSEQDWDLFNQPEPLPDPVKSPFAADLICRCGDHCTNNCRCLCHKDEIEPEEPEQVIALSADETKLEIVTEQKPEVREEPAQVALFEKGEWWEEHWKGMPEFVQKDATPFKTIYVHFETRADMESFAKLVGQRIGLNTLSIWHPEMEVNDFSRKRYIDAPPKQDEGTEVID